MKPHSGEDAEIEALTESSRKLLVDSPRNSSGKNVHPPNEILLQIFKNIDPEGLSGARFASSKLERAATTVIQAELHRAASEIYDYFIPEGKELAEISEFAPQSSEIPPTFHIMQVQASLMNVIPEKMPHFVSTIIGIKDDHIKSRCIAAASYSFSRFAEKRLLPWIDKENKEIPRLIDTALGLAEHYSSDEHSVFDLHTRGAVFRDPKYPAFKALRRLKSCRTEEQNVKINNIIRKNIIFKDGMRPREEDNEPDCKVYSRVKLARSISEINRDSLEKADERHYIIIRKDQMEDMQRYAYAISEATDRFTKPFVKAPARDFSQREQAERSRSGSRSD